MGAADGIAIVETGYRAGETDEAWLRDVLETLRPSLDAGLGIIGFFFDRSRDDPSCVWGAVSSGADPRFARSVPDLYGGMPGPIRNALLSGTQPISTTSELLGMGAPATEQGPDFLREVAGALGFSDSLGVAVTDASARGCIFGVPLPEARRLDRPTRQHWARLTAHLASGLRLHRALAAADAPPSPEAVLDPSGRVHDATGPAQARTARDRLRAAVVAMERARGPLRREAADEALALWPALVEGRWSLVDRFDTDGRRYVVALRNDVQVPDPRALSPRERVIAHGVALGRANKDIAYELGIAPGTVGALVARVARKLGVASRAELVRLLGEAELSDVTLATLDGGPEIAIVTSREPADLGLTPRQTSVARAAAAGMSNEAIAAELGLSPRTVANVMASVFRRLEVGSRGQLARRFVSGGG